MKLRVSFAKSLVVAALYGSLFVAVPKVAISQAAQTQRPTSTPYTGDLSIFEKPGRDERLQIQRVMDLLGIKAGSSVADIGAGSGWFSMRAAARVGGSGRVYAQDINPDAVKYIQNRIHKEKVGNVKTVLGSPDDPKLPSDSIDAVLLLKVYHEIAHPLVFMTNLKSSLRSGAKVGIIDRNGNGTDHGLNSDVVRREMAEAGFKPLSSYDFTKADGQDYFLLFAVR
ncbi:MAG: class I SAM-dependent methyltransferase [Candidatus Sulfotelmatobacter sp.]